MFLSSYQYFVDLVSAYSFWAGPIAFTLAFAGSLVGMNIFIPVGLILTSAVALIGSGLTLWTLIPWIIIGAALGSGVSYALGSWLGSRMRDHWPFQYRPELFERAHAVFEHYGILAVFIGYFIGPLRGPIPVAAGIAGMPYVQFHIASVVAAVIWTLTVIAPGAILHQSFGPNNPILLVASLIVPVVIFGIVVGILMLRRVLNRIKPTAPQAVVHRLVNPSKSGYRTYHKNDYAAR